MPDSLDMMGLLGRSVNRFIRHFSGSPIVAKLAVLVRNQCNLLLGYHLAPSPDGKANGEYWLLGQLQGQIQSFIDVGANRGEWTRAVLARNSTSHGICVDAGEASITHLRDMELANVTVIHAAVSDKAGVSLFYEQPNAGEHSSLTQAHQGGVAREVKCVTIDELTGSNDQHVVDFVKIDAEGWDFHVLLGAERALRERCIGLLQFEYGPAWADAGSTLKRAIAFLHLYDYEVWELRPKGLQRHIYTGEFFAYSNFIAASGTHWITRAHSN